MNITPLTPPSHDNIDITRFINKLPDDIRKKIYFDNFHIKHKCDKLLNWFNDNSKLKCSPMEVEDITNEILQSKEGIEYMIKHNDYFEKVYISHFIQNEKGFRLMNKTNSLITSILMYMWH